MKNTAFLLFTVFLLPVALAGAEGTPIGGDPVEEWHGPYDHLVIGGSFIDDQVTLSGEGENPQGDTCLPTSSYTLLEGTLPDDAVMVKGYLIWMSAVDPTKLKELTDNTVHLSFVHAEGFFAHQQDIVASDIPKLLGDTSDPFLFESVNFSAAVATGCTQTDPGATTTADLAYFTYRVDVTQFLNKIQQTGSDSGFFNKTSNGRSFNGTYTLSELDCTEDDVYRCKTLMVSNWALLIVYRSMQRTQQRVALYSGFAFLRDQTVEHALGYPANKVRLTMLAAEGDPKMAGADNEYVSASHTLGEYTRLITDDCDGQDGYSYQVWDSRPSFFTFDPVGGKYCSSNEEPYTFGLDIDKWLLDPATDEELKLVLQSAGQGVFSFAVADDEILTNLLVVTEDVSIAAFDIPPEATDWPSGREKHYCSCIPQESAVCFEQEYAYLIKVQNWGDAAAHEVMVSDAISVYLDYLPGSTEMATEFDENGVGLDWTVIPDGPGDTLPLSGDGYRVADTMSPCEMDTLSCTDTRLIRFKVKPKPGLPKTIVIENSAIIKEAAAQEGYRTNASVPLKLHSGTCLPITDCAEQIAACSGIFSSPATDEDTILGADEDAVVADDSVHDDDETMSDADTVKPKDTGCGCSMAW